MPRRVQDIIPSQHRSIRDIPVDRRSSHLSKSEPSSQKVPPDSGEVKRAHSDVREKKREVPLRRIPSRVLPPVEPSRSTGRGHRSWFWMILVVVILVAGVAFVASTRYARATFTIVPRSLDVPVSGTYVGQASVAPGGTAIAYELMTMNGSASTTVPASEGQRLSVKAQGTISIHNAYGASAQRLVAGTRFSDSSGHIYRTTSSVVIPGYTKSGGTIVPGTVSATVVADQPGAEYNIYKSGNVSDFKIVAYKGTPRYETIYGRQTSDISGGFVGTKKVVSPETLSASVTSLKEKLLAGLLPQVIDSVPDGYILFDSLRIQTFSEPVVSGNESNSAVVTIRGTLTVVALDQDQLVQRLAGEQAGDTFGTFGYVTPNIQDLSVSMVNAKDFSPTKKNSLLMHIKGDIKLVAVVPVEEVKKALVGVPLAQTQELLRPYAKAIETGSGELVPPWSKVPSDPERISVIITEPKPSE